MNFFSLKFEIFLGKTSPHTPYKVQKDRFRSLQKINYGKKSFLQPILNDV